MSGLGYILGGFTQGIGAGLVKQGEAQAATQAEDAKFRRELALKGVDHQNRMTEDANQSDLTAGRDKASSGYRITEQTNQADLTDRNDARHTARSTVSQIAVDKARTTNDAALARLKSGLQITEDQAKAASTLSNELALAGQTVGDLQIAADGSIWAYSKTGVALGHSKPGKFVPPAAPGGGLDASALLGGSAPAKPSAAAPGSPVSTSNW
ncbi:hypothetical protein [Novosphingobium sp. FKTRR1]|uniref:hypothetical protein n=1 Tax=Novosphingobium sp. FKTRR1 TaxID=2879118 RepID=UPI001CEFB396|nr:hypothetical protein [Novosphingobium sp. FKTRR1]